MMACELLAAWGKTNQLATINVGCEILDGSQEEY